MDAGKMRETVELLTLRETGAGFAWEPAARIWTQVRRVSGTNLFSRVGLGRPTIEFVLRRRELTLHQAFRLRGRHCFLTEILPSDDRLYMTVRAALAEPTTCTVLRETVRVDNAMRRPVRGADRALSFPAVLTEKYVKATADTPQTATETAYVLVTQKQVALRTGELVTVGAGALAQKYTVLVCHELDDYKSEYEIVRTEDA